MQKAIILARVSTKEIKIAHIGLFYFKKRLRSLRGLFDQKKTKLPK
jgi:hypothetical protein